MIPANPLTTVLTEKTPGLPQPPNDQAMIVGMAHTRVVPVSDPTTENKQEQLNATASERPEHN